MKQHQHSGGAKKDKPTDHYAKKIALRDFSLRILIDLHQPLRIRPDGDDHPSRARELLHERRRYRPRRRAHMNRVVRALLSVPYGIFRRGGGTFQFAPSKRATRCGWKTLTESPVACDEHDRLFVDGGAEPVRAYVLLRERGERRYVLDADDGVRAATATITAALLHTADEVVAHARKVARACADVEHARAGTAAQIREEELGCVRVLCFAVSWGGCGPWSFRAWSYEENGRRLRAMWGAEMVAS